MALDLSTYAVVGQSYNDGSGELVAVRCTPCGGLTVGMWDTTEDEHATVQDVVQAASDHHNDKHKES
ncbi:hypothetical protein OH715_16910 [Streptomyces cellulosae]|nr:hypothetical protein OH715_16910 [Streptomyces cellulosae]